ncbi:MAG: NADH-quinone oxidoreductase subunit NuoK [Candidatus Sericytochromatia bacterium]|nr:NADH-quinone oxidoreductase subunit NuoK [Candidatus Tanganyikabacteria bacterium]
MTPILPGFIGLHGYLLVSAALFFIGVAGFVARRNVFAVLMSVELMLNAVNLSFVAFSRYWRHVDGQVMVLLIIAVAAAEAAVALAMVILLFRNRATLDVDAFRAMGETEKGQLSELEAEGAR